MPRRLSPDPPRRRNPHKLPEFLNANPSYVFFRELPKDLGGPLGSLGVPLTAERSIAVDPRVVPLGDAARAQAGKMRQAGRMWVLLPKGYPPPSPIKPGNSVRALP